MLPSRAKTRERPGLTLATGALVALQRRHRSAMTLIRTALAREVPLRIPVPVVAEFWRGSTNSEVEDLIRLRAVAVDRVLAQQAGEALAIFGHGPSAIDAMVAAVANAYGDDVLTSDPDDFETLRAHFRELGDVTRV